MIKKSVRVSPDNTIFEIKASLKLSGCPLAISIGSGKVLYVLLNSNHIVAIDADSMTILKDIEPKDFEGTALSFASATNEVWVGDKKGLIHILDGADLSQKALIEKKHNHTVTVMTSSKDGKLVASGDSYRYIYVFNTETKEEVGCFAYHIAKIIGLDFNSSGTSLLTACLDRSVGIANLADKTNRVVPKPNEKELTAAVFNDEDGFYTAGNDCSIRLWRK